MGRSTPAAIRQILNVLINNALVHGTVNIAVTGNQMGRGAVLGVVNPGLGVVFHPAIASPGPISSGN